MDDAIHRILAKCLQPAQLVFVVFELFERALKLPIELCRVGFGRVLFSLIRNVGPDERDVLGLFAEGLGALMERNIVVERMMKMRGAAEDHLAVVDAFATPYQPEDADSPDPGVSADIPAPDDPTERLTRRERRVLDLLAAGETIAHIAAAFPFRRAR